MYNRDHNKDCFNALTTATSKHLGHRSNASNHQLYTINCHVLL